MPLIARTALMITGFVLVMMLLIEYLNVLSEGGWQERLSRHVWGQYLLGAILGTIPGCLGAFAAVAMYSHGILTLGALVTTMIATSGDEAFVMLALFPRQALHVMGVLFTSGIAVGILVDAVTGRRRTGKEAGCLEIHEQDRRMCMPAGMILHQWKGLSPVRGTMTVALMLFLGAVATGQLGPPDWNWIRITLIAAPGLALAIVLVVPEHFLEEHLWRHVVQQHGGRVFLWTFGALAAIHLLTDVLHMEAAIQQGRWFMLVLACLLGLIPESGPHMVVVTMFAEGMIPISILVASSVVQDGHGMLPMLAHSRQEFLLIKGINLLAGMGLGAAAMGLGF